MGINVKKYFSEKPLMLCMLEFVLPVMSPRRNFILHATIVTMRFDFRIICTVLDFFSVAKTLRTVLATLWGYMQQLKLK